MRGLHASLTVLLLAVSHGYILCMNFKMGDKFAVKYPFWVCATILNNYVHVFLMTSQIRWYQFQAVIQDYSRQNALKRWEPITQATGLLGPLHTHVCNLFLHRADFPCSQDPIAVYQCSKLLPVRLPEADNFEGGPGTFLKIFLNLMFMIWDSRQEDWQLFWLSFEHWVYLYWCTDDVFLGKKKTHTEQNSRHFAGNIIHGIDIIILLIWFGLRWLTSFI